MVEAQAPAVTATTVDVRSLRRCDEVESPFAPGDWYRDTPVYVGNEMPVEEVRGFASQFDGYESIWIDRAHNGWVTVGFVDTDVATVQAALEAQFPGVGVVAVEMRSTAELEEIRHRIDNELPEGMAAQNVYETRGAIEVWVGEITPERVALVAGVAGDDPVCISGWDPGDRPPPGPQPAGGDGWRYLAEVDERSAGDRPHIVADQTALLDLWSDLGQETDLPDVDFDTEIVAVFTVHHSSSCPETRLDDVMITGDVVHAVIVHVNEEMACTMDGVPRTYLVSLDRASLPPPPFQVTADIEIRIRITVDTDLRIPGSVPDPGDITDTAATPPRTATPMPFIIETGFAFPVTIDVTCGIGFLGPINDVTWAAADGPGELPDVWLQEATNGLLDIELLITEGPDPTLAATAGGQTITYIPTAQDPPGCG